LVCSSSITVGEALHTANRLHQGIVSSETEVSTVDQNLQDDYNVDSIVHAAVGILRKRILRTNGLDNEYYSSAEMSLSAQKTFVDPLLYKAVGWLASKKRL
jgi:hypothetical protein